MRAFKTARNRASSEMTPASAPAGTCLYWKTRRVSSITQAIAYKRQPGKVDPDSDSASTVNLTPMRVP